MKKVLYAILALATLTLASCEKEPIGGTATEKMAGQWYVHLQHIDADGSVMYDGEDLFGVGQFWVITFNTAANNADSLFVQDVDGALWDFKVKTACDLSAGTFSIKGGENLQYPCSADITGGKILLGAATTPSGMKADSIVFDILFDDDPYAAPNEEALGEDFEGAYYDHLRVTGYRYTGLANDD